MGLHYDLTVPFARYVLENAGKLEFPFRRYQIQPAWRGERPQEGRYRQFNQADIDVVGRDELPFHHDVEVVRVMVEALGALPLPPLSFQVNNRKLIQGFYRGLGIPDVAGGDPRHRQARQAAAPRPSPRCCVETAGATAEQAEQVPGAGRRSASPTRRSSRRGARASASRTSCWRPGLAELAAVVDGCASGRPATTSRSRPTCASPAASTTTPAPSSRSSWPATSA